jgi:hypothetical protein
MRTASRNFQPDRREGLGGLPLRPGLMMVEDCSGVDLQLQVPPQPAARVCCICPASASGLSLMGLRASPGPVALSVRCGAVSHASLTRNTPSSLPCAAARPLVFTFGAASLVVPVADTATLKQRGSWQPQAERPSLSRLPGLLKKLTWRSQCDCIQVLAPSSPARA